MKKMLFSMICMLFACISLSAQVKTYETVTGDERMVVNASDCKEAYGSAHRLWVRYDYLAPKFCKEDAKDEGIKGKPVRAEVLYEFDEYMLQYRIIRKVYYDKKEHVVGQVNYPNASYNSLGDTDYSLKIAHFMANYFHMVVG